MLAKPNLPVGEILYTNESHPINQHVRDRTTQCSGVNLGVVNSSENRNFISTRASEGSYRLLISKGLPLAAESVSVMRISTLYEKIRRTEKKVFIQNASAYFEASRLHAIASPNASNSLEMLDILSGARAPTLGVVTCNGIPVQAALFRQNVGWVQFEQTFTKLTNFKNICIHLNRRRRCARSEKIERVKSVLKFVELESSKKSGTNTKVENLLLHIALELVWDPPVLFVVDPLQGLRTDEYLLVSNVLSRITVDLRKTVIISTGMLPLMLYEKLDTLMVVGTGGHIFYSGNMTNVSAYYNSLRLNARYTSLINKVIVSSPNLTRKGPEFTSIDINLRNSILEEECVGKNKYDDHRPLKDMEDNNDSIASTFHSLAVTLPELKSQMDQGREDTDLDSLTIDDGDTILDLAKLWSYSPMHCIHYSCAFNESEFHKLQTKRGISKAQRDSGNMQSSSSRLIGSFLPSHLKPGIVIRTIATLQGDIEQTVRQVEIYVALMSVILLLLFAAWAMSKQNDDQIGMQNIRGIVFFMFFMIGEVNTALYINTLERDTRAFKQQQKSGVMSPIVYIFILATKAILSRIILVILLSIFASFVLPSDMRVSLISGLVAIFSIAHLFLTYLVVLIFMSVRLARYISYGFTSYFVFLSGFLINLKSIPVFLGYTSLIRYGYGAVIRSFLAGKPYSCDNGNVPLNVSSYCYTGDQYLQLQGLEHDTKWRAATVLGVTSVILTLLCWIRLRFMW
eukprot:Tbor_TRINITY_DN1823_c0_g1::TRINITY_DN1823_c0_g1_i1::g.23059::m.23059